MQLVIMEKCGDASLSEMHVLTFQSVFVKYCNICDLQHHGTEFLSNLCRNFHSEITSCGLQF